MQHREHAEALDELERLRAAGKISPGKYEVHRQAILNEMKPVPWALRIVGMLAFVMLVLMVLGFIGRMIAP